MTNPFKAKPLPYSEAELREYVIDLERLTVLRDKSKAANMLDDAEEYSVIITNMQRALAHMIEQNTHHHNQQKELRK